MGNRLTESINGTLTTNYLWDTQAPMPMLYEETNNKNALVRSYTYDPTTASPLSMTTSGGSFYYLHDPLGDVSDFTDSKGATQYDYTYEPYGPALKTTQVATKAPANPILYTGQYLDDTSLYNLRAREYDQTTGRFLTVDPLLAVTRQPYAYAADSPTTRIDPSGLFDRALSYLSHTYLPVLREKSEAAGYGYFAELGIGASSFPPDPLDFSPSQLNPFSAAAAELGAAYYGTPNDKFQTLYFTAGMIGYYNEAAKIADDEDNTDLGALYQQRYQEFDAALASQLAVLATKLIANVESATGLLSIASAAYQLIGDASDTDYPSSGCQRSTTTPNPSV